MAGSTRGMRWDRRRPGREAKLVRRVRVEAALAIARELWVCVSLARHAGRPIVMASAAGGMDIEEVAARDPGAILRQEVAPLLGLLAFEGRGAARRLGLSGPTAGKGAKVPTALVRAYLATAASLVRINPL